MIANAFLISFSFGKLSIYLEKLMEDSGKALTFYNGGFEVCLTLREKENILGISCIHQATEYTYKLSVTSQSFGLAGGICDTPTELHESLIKALQKEPKWGISLERKGGDVLQLKLSFQLLATKTLSVNFELKKEEPGLGERLDKLINRMGPYAQCIEDKLVKCHNTIELFHGGWAMVKVKDTKSHDSASSGVAFTTGKHYLECRIIRCTSNLCMIGVQDSLDNWTGHPGHASHSSGKALYGNNGHCYHDDTNDDYGLGVFGPGDYVGVLLDMDARAVCWTVNGRKGATRPLIGKAYCIAVNLYSVGDALEILPEYSYHSA